MSHFLLSFETKSLETKTKYRIEEDNCRKFCQNTWKHFQMVANSLFIPCSATDHRWVFVCANSKCILLLLLFASFSGALNMIDWLFTLIVNRFHILIITIISSIITINILWLVRFFSSPLFILKWKTASIVRFSLSHPKRLQIQFVFSLSSGKQFQFIQKPKIEKKFRMDCAFSGKTWREKERKYGKNVQFQFLCVCQSYLASLFELRWWFSI